MAIIFSNISSVLFSLLLLGLQLQVFDDLILSHSSSMLCFIIFHSLFFWVFTFGWFLLTYLQVHWFSPQPVQVYWAYSRNSCKDLYSCPGLTRVIFLSLRYCFLCDKGAGREAECFLPQWHGIPFSRPPPAGVVLPCLSPCPQSFTLSTH